MSDNLTIKRVGLKCVLVRAAQLFLVASLLAGLALSLGPAPRVMADAPVWTDLGIVYSAPSGDAYYPSVIYDANGFGSGSPLYKMWYSNGSGGVFVTTSSNGTSWGAPTSSGGLGGDAHHAQVVYDSNCFGATPCDSSGAKYKMWYWDTDAQLYSICAMATAKSIDGVNWTGDTTLTQSVMSPLVTGNCSTGGGAGWNRGSYGPIAVFYQPGASNTGTDPWAYSYVMYYDGTDGGREFTGLAYSADGLFWTAYSGNPVLSGSPTAAWDCSDAAYGAVYRDAGGYHFWYSGGGGDNGSGECQDHPVHEGIGYAFSSDGKSWTKDANNPVFHISDGVSYRNKRVYTPAVVDDGSGLLKMYYSAQGSSGSKKIGLAVNVETPSVVFVDDDWVGLSLLTKVMLPGDPTPHYIGFDAFAVIQGGVNAVASGGTVNVAAGTYTEQVTIDKSVTLVSDTGDYRTTGTMITGASTVRLASGANSIAIQGFKFQDIIGTVGGVIYSWHADRGNSMTIRSNSFVNIGPNAAVKTFGDTIKTGWLITDNKIDGVTGTDNSGLWLLGLCDSEISNNEIKNTTYAGMILDTLQGVAVSGNRISDTPRKGIQVAHSSNVTVTGNTITNTNTLHVVDEGAITVYPDTTDIRIVGNTLVGNYQGVTIRAKTEAVAPNVHVNFNRIFGNGGFGVGNFAQGGGTLDATNNWWGCNAGPGAAGCDAMSANVGAGPWLVLRISASPVAIPTEGTSALTADLIVNSDDVDTSASGHIPDGTGVTFSGTLGSVAPTAVGTTGGIVTATFTAGTIAGAAIVSATVDNQTVSTTIDINAPIVAIKPIYLPIILNNYASNVIAPDLVVDDIIVTNPDGAAGIQVIIKNQGNAAVNDEFWVDFYIDPNPPPASVNQTWNYPPGRCAEGLVWGVVASALPIMPGDTLTLTYGGAYYDPSRSNFSGSFAVGAHDIYAQVDSANANTAYGAVRESHEITGEAYNNIRGEVLNVAGAGVTSPPPMVEGKAAPETLPPRPGP